MRILLASPDSVAPSIALTSPAAGNVSGTITISANASDNYAVAGVQFKMDGNNIGAEDTSAPFSVTYDTHLLANGGHTITAVARDAAGNTTTATTNINVTNGLAGSYLNFDEWQGWNGDDGAYEGGRTTGPGYDQRWDYDYIWSAVGSKNALFLPGNPDPTHYQMRIQFGTNNAGRFEGGSDGNQIHIYMAVGGTEYDVWNNGPGWGPWRSGPVINVNGGEGIRLSKWETISGMNTSFSQGAVCYYDFVPKPGYAS